MYFSRRSTRTISAFTFEFGTSTFLCFALQALRMQVSRSAIGSVTDMFSLRAAGYPTVSSLRGSPARLHHARDLTHQGQLPEADPADAEIPKEGPGTAAAVAAVVLPYLEFGLPLPFLDDRLLGHSYPPARAP